MIKAAALLVFVALCFTQANSQLPVPAPVPVPAPLPLPVPVPVPLGLGLGFGPFGLGFGGLGFGGLGLGLGLGFPFGRFGLGFGRFGLGGLGFGARLRFGRSVEDMSEVWRSQNKTICRFEQARSMIRCEGESNIECGVEARLDDIKNITVKLPGLSVFPDVIRVTGQKDIPTYRLLSRVIGDATLIQPRTDRRVVVSLYSSPIVTETGFLVKDAKCFEKFDTLFNTVGVENVRFSLNTPARA